MITMIQKKKKLIVIFLGYLSGADLYCMVMCFVTVHAYGASPTMHRIREFILHTDVTMGVHVCEGYHVWAMPVGTKL